MSNTETRAEVRRKVSALIRGRWFEPPFSGPGFSGLLLEGLEAMAAGAPIVASDIPGYRDVITNGVPVTVRS